MHLRHLAVAAATAVFLAACNPGISQTPVPASTGHVSVTTTIQGHNGTVKVSYRVTNWTSAAVVITTGIPAQDSSYLPEAQEGAVYRFVRTDGVLEIASRSFANASTADGRPLLLRGKKLDPASSYSTELTLASGFTQYVPGKPRTPIDLAQIQHAIFCLGVIDVAELDNALQPDDSSATPASAATPIVHHGVTQTVVCSPREKLS